MVDRDLLERAAKAAGLHKRICWQNSANQPLLHAHEYWMRGGPGTESVQWNPLTNDADALRLAVQLRFAISIDSYIGPHGFVRVYASESVPAAQEPTGHDAQAATRRAIVRAASALCGNDAETDAELKEKRR